MYKRKELAIPVFFCVAMSIYSLFVRYFFRPMPLLVLCGVLLAVAYIRMGRPLKVPRMLAFILVFVLIAFLNFLVFVMKVRAEQALVYFLIILQLAKAFTLVQFKDYIQVMSLSALGILAAGSYNPDPSFPAVLVVYFCAGGYWIYKFHMVSEYVAHYREKEVSPVVILHPDHFSWVGPFIRTSAVTCSIALIIFSVIPRRAPSWGFSADLFGQQFSSTGFSQELTLGAMSKILEDKTPVLRAKYLPEEDQRKNYSGVLYLRGAAYDQYVQQGNTWQWLEERQLGGNRRLNQTSNLTDPSIIQAPLWKKANQNLWRLTFEQAITTTNMFVIDRPLAVAVNQVMNLSYNAQTNIVYSGSQCIPKGVNYQLLTEQNFSDMKTLPLTTQPAADRDKNDTDDYATRFSERFCETQAAVSSAPSGVEETRAEAGRGSLFLDLRRGPKDDYVKPVTLSLDAYRPFAQKAIGSLPAGATDVEKIDALESWLKNNYAYTLDNRDVDRSVEPILDFLNRRKHGHCEYFASSLVLLAQSLGYEARVVAGFKDGEFNSFGDYYVVRNCDAHAWSEVLIPNVGWVRYDPTPPTRDDMLRSQDNSSFKWFWDIVDLMQYSWTDRLASTEGTNRQEFMEGLHKQVMGPDDRPKETTAWSLRSVWKWMVGLFKGRSYKSVFVQVIHFVLVLTLLGIVLFLVRIFIDVMFILWITFKQYLHRRWEKRYGLIWYCPIDFYRKLLLWLAARGVVRGRQETAEDFVVRMGQIRPDIEKNFSFLTKVYLAIRFGGKRVNLKQKTYLAHLTDLIQQAILTTRVVTREILVERPVHESAHSQQEQAEDVGQSKTGN